MTTFATANIVTAFDDRTIGTKVIDPMSFWADLKHTLAAHDPSQDRQEGQHFIVMKPKTFPFVSGGVGEAQIIEDAYVLRFYRGSVRKYLKRRFALPVRSLACVVYTREAYLIDPDVVNDHNEIERISRTDATHVLVAVIASHSTEPSPLPMSTFVHNLAGGNLEAQKWTADEIRAKAQEIEAFWTNHSIVAD
jgi:hypothetical protein